MSSLTKKVSRKAGSPESVIYIGNGKTEKVKIQLIDYSENQFQEKEIQKVEDCFPFKDSPTVSWVNVTGIHETEIIEKIGKRFGLHPLILEDIVNTNQRTKVEDYDQYLFLVLKMIFYNDKTNEVTSEQVSLVLGNTFVISFQETEGDVFDSVRNRIRTSKGRIRKMGTDYLAYSLLDAIVDSYFGILEKIGERIEALEEKVIKNPTSRELNTVYRLKHDLIVLRKSIWPLREVINSLQREESELIQKSTILYLRDVYDHTIQIIDSIETFRDMVTGLLDVYLSSISNKLNEVMKVLTIISTIFIPLTFIAGVYGMNFKYMPELDSKIAYPILWIIMISLAVLMMVFFKKRKWI